MTVTMTPEGPVISIKTSQALRGFVASDPVLSPEGDHERLDMTVGQPRWGRDPDGNHVRLEPDLCHLIMRGTAAAKAQSALRLGDLLIAAGRLEVEDTLNLVTGHTEQQPVFVADRIGPDCAELSYQVMLHRVQPRPGILEPVKPVRPAETSLLPTYTPMPLSQSSDDLRL